MVGRLGVRKAASGRGPHTPYPTSPSRTIFHPHPIPATITLNLLPRFSDALSARYRVERELGRGGMATVYLAHDLKHDRAVALKVLHPELAATLGPERFKREILLAARLQHPHILTIHDSGEDGSQCWFTMPFVEGESLRTRLQRDTQLPLEVALSIVRQTAQALEYAHQHGVIHRDIKPENLLLTQDGNVLVADFGIARLLDGSDQALTETGLAVGTPTYMSPEQSAAERVLDARTDIYSVGIVLYELLAGEPPFTGPTAQAVIAKRLSGAAPSVRVVRPAVPERVDRLLRKALAMVPADRYATMTECRIVLDDAIAGLRDVAPSRRRPWLLAVALVSLLLLAIVFARRASSPGGAEAADGALPTSAAVLPFADQSPGKDQEYFSDGLTEELTNALARIPGLRVVARSSAFQFKGSSVDVREVGRRLGVSAVLGGSVRRSGQRLRVSAQLVDARSGYELWSDSYDRDVADVFQVQEDIARSITAALRVRLADRAEQALRARPTGDVQAYDLFLKGRFALNQRTGSTLLEAAQYFNQAVARDSILARAWAGIADANVLLPLYTGISPDTAWPRARAAALRAIALDSTSAEALTALAYGTMLYEWDWAASERVFRRAIAADSTYPTAHHWYGDFLAGRGRWAEARDQFAQAERLDPLTLIIGSELAWSWTGLHRPEVADSILTRILRLNPNYAQALLILGMVRIEQRRYPEAISTLKRSLDLDGEFAHGQATLAAAYARAGDQASARALLDSLTARSAREYVPPVVFAIVHANLGEMDRAFAALDRGIREKDVLLPENFFEPLLDPLKIDPRYRGIADRFRGK